MIIKFTIPKLPPSLNTMLRQHWRAREKEQKVWDQYMYLDWIHYNRPVFLKPIKITYILKVKAFIRRDIDNYIGGTKYLTDALKRTFITRDDYQWLKSISVEFVKGNNETLVRIEEL